MQTNYVYELDQTTQQIMNAIVEAQETSVGGRITVPHSQEKIDLSRHVTLAELRRLRKQFTQLNKMHTLPSKEKIAEAFVSFLNSSLNIGR